MGKNLKSFESFEDPIQNTHADIKEVIQDLQDSYTKVRVTPGIMVTHKQGDKYSSFLPHSNRKDYSASGHVGTSIDAFEIVIENSESDQKAALDEGQNIVYFSLITDEYSKSQKAMNDFIERIKTIDSRVLLYRNPYFKSRNSNYSEDRVILALPS